MCSLFTIKLHNYNFPFIENCNVFIKAWRIIIEHSTWHSHTHNSLLKKKLFYDKNLSAATKCGRRKNNNKEEVWDEWKKELLWLYRYTAIKFILFEKWDKKIAIKMRNKRKKKFTMTRVGWGWLLLKSNWAFNLLQFWKYLIKLLENF